MQDEREEKAQTVLELIRLSAMVRAHRCPWCSACKWLALNPDLSPWYRVRARNLFRERITALACGDHTEERVWFSFCGHGERLQTAASLLLMGPADGQGVQHTHRRAGPQSALHSGTKSAKAREGVEVSAMVWSCIKWPEKFSLTKDSEERSSWRRLAALSFPPFQLVLLGLLRKWHNHYIVIFNLLGKQIRSVIVTSLTTTKLTSCIYKDLNEGSD